MEADRRRQLVATKFKSLLESSLGIDASDAVVDPNFNRGVALSLNGSAWIFVAEDINRALGACLAWAESKLPNAREINIVIEGDAGVVARRARNFSRRINILQLAGDELVEAEPKSFAAPIEAKGSHLEMRSLIEQGGAACVVEHGVVAGEVHGLEVCRVTDGDNGPRLEVGVGVHDREAFALLHGHLPTVDAIKKHVQSVLPHRETSIGSHPLNRLAASRLLRARIIAAPQLIGAAHLEAVEPPVPRTNLKDEVPCVALGRTESGAALVAVFAYGIDLDTVPFAVDARAWTSPGAELVVVVPERDKHALMLKMAEMVLGGCAVVGVSV